MDQRHRGETTREEIDDLEQILPQTRLNERWPDDVTTIRTAAPAAALLLSRSPELPEGSPMICCMTEQQMRAFRQDLNLLRQLGRVREWELRPRSRDGATVDATVTVITVRDREGRPISLCQLVRDLAEREQAQEEIQRRNRQLAALNAITAAVSSSLVLSDVLAALKHKLASELDVPGGAIFIRHELWHEFFLEEGWGLPRPVLAELRRIPLTGYLSGQVLDRKETLLCQEVQDVPAFVVAGLSTARPEWEHCLWVQLLVHDKIQGVVALLGPASSIHHHDEPVFFHALGQQVGVAIQNARLFEQVRAGRKQLQALSRQLVELQENERRDVARELHDEIGQLLTGLRLALELAARPSANTGRAHPAQILSLVDELIARVRRLSLDLRPAMLDDLGLVPALLWQIERYTALTEVGVTFEHAGLLGRQRPAVETAAYRIVQEALTNVARHAGVKQARVRLRIEQDTLCVQIEDAGRGFDPTAALAGGASSGLTGMRERTRLLGGHLRVESAPGAGTRLTAELPLTYPEERNEPLTARTATRDPPCAVPA